MRIHPEVKYYALGLLLLAAAVFTVVKIIQEIA